MSLTWPLLLCCCRKVGSMMRLSWGQMPITYSFSPLHMLWTVPLGMLTCLWNSHCGKVLDTGSALLPHRGHCRTNPNFTSTILPPEKHFNFKQNTHLFSYPSAYKGCFHKAVQFRLHFEKGLQININHEYIKNRNTRN